MGEIGHRCSKAEHLKKMLRKKNEELIVRNAESLRMACILDKCRTILINLPEGVVPFVELNDCLQDMDDYIEGKGMDHD